MINRYKIAISIHPSQTTPPRSPGWISSIFQISPSKPVWNTNGAATGTDVSRERGAPLLSDFPTSAPAHARARQCYLRRLPISLQFHSAPAQPFINTLIP